MKKRDVERKLKELGWWYLRDGADHDIWTNGMDIMPVPRHKEIKEPLAKSIIRQAKGEKKR